MNTFKEWSPMFSIILAETQEASISHETIESIIQQDLGFEENIQLILLLNNDNCLVDEVCQQYATQFPRNIIVVKKEYENVLEAWFSFLKRKRLKCDFSCGEGAFMTMNLRGEGV